MKGYKLINNRGGVYGIFNDKEYANISANQNFVLRGTFLKMEEIVMPKFEPLYYEFIHFGGRQTDYKAPNKERLQELVEAGGEPYEKGRTIAFGYDVNDNECYLIEEAA